MLSPILYYGPTRKLRTVLDDEWIVGCIGHDLAFILVDEIGIAEEDLNNNTKYRKDFLETEDRERVQTFGSICNIPVAEAERVEVGVVRYDKESWGLDAFFVIPEEDFVDESLEFNPREDEWQRLFRDALIVGFSSDDIRQKVLAAAEAVNSSPEVKQRFVKQFNQTLPRYQVEYDSISLPVNDEGYRLEIKFIKTSDHRWSIKSYLSVPLQAVADETLGEPSDE